MAKDSSQLPVHRQVEAVGSPWQNVPQGSLAAVAAIPHRSFCLDLQLSLAETMQRVEVLRFPWFAQLLWCDATFVDAAPRTESSTLCVLVSPGSHGGFVD